MFALDNCIKARLLFIFMVLFILSFPTASQIDNCCSVDRQCNTDEQWISGYWAFQNNECAAPSQQRQSSSSQSQPQTATSEDVDNCCFSGWQCDTDQDWASGYFAFQLNQCDSQSQSQQSQGSDQPQQQNSNQPQPQNDNQPQQQNNNQPQQQNDNQPQQRNDNQPQPQNDNQPQPQNDDQPQQQNDDPQVERHTVVIDLTDPDPEPTETEDGTPVYIRRAPPGTACSLFPNLSWCR